MGGLVLACGSRTPQPPAGVGRTVALPARPGKQEVDPLLTESDSAHLIVLGTDADLAAVVLRLLRKDRLGGIRVGFVPAHRRSYVARRWGLPVESRRAFELARDGAARPVPLIRDDSGGILLARGRIAPIRAVAYCDERLVLNKPARSLELRPSDPDDEGMVTTIVSAGMPRRKRRHTSRALQMSFDPKAPARPVSDGVPRERPAERWTWYRHTEDLPLIRP